MNKILTFPAEMVMPDRAAVLANQGVPGDAPVSSEVEALCGAALRLLGEVAEPTGMFREISGSEFEAVYRGEGENEVATPVGDIFVDADELALFAVTIGERASLEINARFASDDFALACMLDAAASAATERSAEYVQEKYMAAGALEQRIRPGAKVLRYSPGYCGWHMSGQGALFGYLHPEQIGISLGESFLMQPLKSISGVLICGRGEVHDFTDSYPFCRQCDTHGCRERIRAMFAE